MRSLITAIALSLLVGLFTFTPTQGEMRLGERPPWTTSRVQGTPDPPPPYQTERAFANLTFDEPLVLVNHQQSGRMFVAERFGKVHSFFDRQDVSTSDLCLDVDSSIFGLALHPDFERNGYLYVTYLTPSIKGRYILPEECSFMVAAHKIRRLVVLRSRGLPFAA